MACMKTEAKITAIQIWPKEEKQLKQLNQERRKS